MPERVVDVEAQDVVPDGWFPNGPGIEYEPSDLEIVMAKAAVVLEMIGGVISVIAVRRQIGPEQFVPFKYLVKWESYAPSVRLPKEPEAQEPEPEPEEVDVPQEAVEEVELPAHPLDGLVSEPA